ncbi:MAG: FAD-dependent oxidoreductase [Bryobacteraceae bacterium]
MTFDAAIVGAGIVGAACADSLARAGLRVVVIERAVPGGGATAAGMGHIVAMDDSEGQFVLTRYSRDLWDARSDELPRDIEFERRGTLWVAADAEEMRTVETKQAWYVSRGVKAEKLDSKQLIAAEPNLRHGLAGALRVPTDSVIYAPCAAKWLLRRAQLIRTEVTRIAAGTVNLRDGGKVNAPAIVIAAGVDTHLLPGLSVRPRKGHLAITDRFPGFVRHQLVELGYLKSAHGHDNESVAFNIQPRSTGQVLIGSSRQYEAGGAEVEPAILARMLRRAVDYMPALARLPVIRAWAGFRAATPDSLPLIGPHPSLRGVWIATGHEGLGITTSLATGELIAASITGQPPPIPIEPYLPARFAHA